MGRQPFPIAGSLDDALIAGVGQSVQGTVAQNGLVEEAEASPEFPRELLRARVSLPTGKKHSVWNAETTSSRFRRRKSFRPDWTGTKPPCA